MKADRAMLRRVFAKPSVLLVRVTPQGFLSGDERFDQLQGRVTQHKLLRKRFEHGNLICDSTDGVHARNGTLCQACLHPQCRPWLRIHLHGAQHTYIVDLAVTSAQNLLTLDDQLTAEARCLDQCTVRVTVRDRGAWGEVCFQPLGTASTNPASARLNRLRDKLREKRPVEETLKQSDNQLP